MTSIDKPQGSRLLISGFGVRVPDGAQQKDPMTCEDHLAAIPHTRLAVAEAVAYEPPPGFSPSPAPVTRITLEFDVPPDRLEVFDCELSLTLHALEPALTWLRRHGGTFTLSAS